MCESISASSSIERKFGRPFGTWPFLGCMCFTPFPTWPLLIAMWLLTWLLIVEITPGIESSRSSTTSSFLFRLFSFAPESIRLNKFPLPCTTPFACALFPPKFSMCWRTTRSNSLWTVPLSVSPSILKQKWRHFKKNHNTTEGRNSINISKRSLRKARAIKNWRLILTMVKRPSASNVLSMGKVSSRKSSRRRRNDDTESSSRPRPNCNFEQSRSTMGGFWLYCRAKAFTNVNHGPLTIHFL